ncbi:MAG: hypothetical protein ABFC62_03130 [Clostridiaceae bacterium]|nr:hypothetical protein [Eubacteriales bacterium]
MAGALIGVVCGLAALYALARAVRAVSQPQNAGSVGLFVFLNLAVVIAAFVVVVIFFRKDILYCGIGISSVLVIGSMVLFMKNNAKLKRQEASAIPSQENDKEENGSHE